MYTLSRVIPRGKRTDDASRAGPSFRRARVRVPPQESILGTYSLTKLDERNRRRRRRRRAGLFSLDKQQRERKKRRSCSIHDVAPISPMPESTSRRKSKNHSDERTERHRGRVVKFKPPLEEDSRARTARPLTRISAGNRPTRCAPIESNLRKKIVNRFQTRNLTLGLHEREGYASKADARPSPSPFPLPPPSPSRRCRSFSD